MLLEVAYFIFNYGLPRASRNLENAFGIATSGSQFPGDVYVQKLKLQKI